MRCGSYRVSSFPVGATIQVTIAASRQQGVVCLRFRRVAGNQLGITFLWMPVGISPPADEFENCLSNPNSLAVQIKPFNR
jgi:hypothetical protein